MKNRIWSIAAMVLLIAGGCNTKSGNETGHFEVKGKLANADDQQIYLDQLFFSGQQPLVVDTAEMTNGSFSLKGHAAEPGMFRIRLEKEEAGFIFINDAENIPFKADLHDMSLAGPEFNTRANDILKKFLLYMDGQRSAVLEATARIESLKTTKNNDSLIMAEENKLIEREESFKKYMVQFIDSVSDPVVAMFAIGYTRGVETGKLKPAIQSLAKRFPNHQGVNAVVQQFNQFITAPPATSANPAEKPTVGSIAPEITLSTPEGRQFSLSSLRGQYVLIDFWASWCGPCRRENPNIVAAYEKYKGKNFTILGVSLDKDKTEWVEAIRDDKLTWHHISDLKFWNSSVVEQYGFDGIPYNVLVDPEGKIIAMELHGQELHQTLASVLK